MSDGRKAYTDWHWGVEPTEEVMVSPPPIVTNAKDKKRWEKMKLVECGRLVEIHYAPLDNVKRKDKVIKLTHSESNKCHLCFDLDHPNQRLYFILDNPTRARMKKLLRNPYEAIPLKEVSELVGGRHASEDYEKIDVQPVGVMTNVVYACEKKGDGYSFYIHELGEESGIRPVLAMASDGSLWFAGGNYTAPIQGITD